jgi:hypothetical protein
MKAIHLSTLLILALSSPSSAEQWVSLGDMLGSEMDTSSISRRDEFVYLRMRHRIRNEQGLLTMDLNLAVSCPRNFYYIQSGQISSDWSPRVVPMPDLPDDKRTFSLPSENPAFNNMYDFVCQ